MKEKARTDDVCKKIKGLELKFSEEKWKDVLCLADKVIPQLEKLAKQSGQSAEAEAEICNMLKKVKIPVVQ